MGEVGEVGEVWEVGGVWEVWEVGEVWLMRTVAAAVPVGRSDAGYGRLQQDAGPWLAGG